jgi:hypothetical protein
MGPLAIAAMVFACVFGSAMLGCWIRGRLPGHHLEENSLRAVSLGVGMVATLAALVLGLLTASGKSAFDKLTDDFTQTAARVVLLDRALAGFGPEAKEVRGKLRVTYATAIELIFREGEEAFSKLDQPQRLAIIFAGYGMLTANNRTVTAALFVCALCVSGAIFLVEEMARPFDGMLRVSSRPQHEALARLGR